MTTATKPTTIRAYFRPKYVPYSPTMTLAHLAAENWGVDMLPVAENLAALEPEKHSDIVAEVRTIIRDSMKRRMATPTSEKLQPCYREWKTCQRHGHVWRERYHDGRDLACVCSRCGESES